MNKTMSTLAALTFTLALSSAAAAQDTAPDTNYTFEDHVVDGGYDSPEGTVVPGRTRHQRASLVRPRLHFVPELLKTIENI